VSSLRQPIAAFPLVPKFLFGNANLGNSASRENRVQVLGVKWSELLRDGYLGPLITKAGITKVDTGALHVRACTSSMRPYAIL
jgi:hypothetical protein